ncbi:hypothetical protein [Metabacillus fastidiosus]|uniref:hypothetical protein n=1 Tax=Metabacillus fastidiosus TaxID=1458 RepID=UPI002DB65E12|nr:hypothetical protein [Metabacillus fastidiosus]MEC2077750.1 hypothetical protein [Metabacillus fastidiosus]
MNVSFFIKLSFYFQFLFLILYLSTLLARLENIIGGLIVLSISLFGLTVSLFYLTKNKADLLSVLNLSVSLLILFFFLFVYLLPEAGNPPLIFSK